MNVRDTISSANFWQYSFFTLWKTWYFFSLHSLVNIFWSIKKNLFEYAMSKYLMRKKCQRRIVKYCRLPCRNADKSIFSRSREKCSCQNAYLMEFAALNGFARREFFRLRLFLRLNDIRLRNCLKSKLRTVSMVDCLWKETPTHYYYYYYIMDCATRAYQTTSLKSIIFEK